MSNKSLKIKDLYKIIIENRYKISLALIVISAIVGFFINDVGVKDWILTTDKILSLWWSIKFFALLLASFELFLIITNQKQNMSIIAAIVLVFSGCIQWNFTKIDSIILGEIITILIHKIIKNDDMKKNILYAITTIACSIGYMYTFRPYAIAFGYVFFALILWIILKNRKELKTNKSKIITLATTIIICIVGAIFAQMLFENSYLEDRTEKLNSGLSGLFTYIYTALLPYNEFEQREILGGIVSLFPIPMCIALYYMYKKDDHVEFFFPMTVVAVLETVYCISGFPEIINKFTMLSCTSGLRVVPAVQLANLFILFYFLGNVETIFKMKHAIRVTIVAVILLALIQYPTIFASKGFLYLFAAELSLLVFLFLNYSDKKYEKVFLFFLVLISLIGGIPVCFM